MRGPDGRCTGQSPSTKHLGSWGGDGKRERAEWEGKGGGRQGERKRLGRVSVWLEEIEST